MDGYAVRSADITPVMTGEPVQLRVVATIAAGEFAPRGLKRGEAMLIMTGAPVPDGADSVIRKEDTDGGSQKVEIRDARDVWKNIRGAGEDYQRGAVLAKRGTPIKPALLGVLASTGVAKVELFRRPRVAIISSGNELVDIDEFDQVVAARRIVSTNSYTLEAPPTARHRSGKNSIAPLIPISFSPPPEYQSAISITLATYFPLWAGSSVSGRCRCAPVRRSPLVCSRAYRGWDCRATRFRRW